RLLAGRPCTTQLPPDLPLVKVDALLLEQVLVNLVENALKYTPAGSAIRIAARAEDAETILVEVRDEGPGLPPGTEERVFEKFRREERGRGGFGLGLAICRAIVVAHGGRIRAENLPGHGAAFSFTLPLESTRPELPEEALEREA
ncbi:MAG TPA: ATP-binding protein, partial [Vicinamibacteria bacterium]|nr:ATP-binding protein [Vicinamibacteria bacterium]